MLKFERCYEIVFWSFYARLLNWAQFIIILWCYSNHQERVIKSPVKYFYFLFHWSTWEVPYQNKYAATKVPHPHLEIGLPLLPKCPLQGLYLCPITLKPTAGLSCPVLAAWDADSDCLVSVLDGFTRRARRMCVCLGPQAPYSIGAFLAYFSGQKGTWGITVDSTLNLH